MEQEQLNSSQNSVKKYARLDQYQLVKTLGSGYSAKVKLGYDENVKKYYAIKIFKKTHSFQQNQKALKNECEMMRDLKHPNLINLIEIKEEAQYVKKNGNQYKTMALVLEYAQKGELFWYVSLGGKFREEVARTYFRQLIEGLQYLHQKGFCHRDLKLDNLLFDENFQLKITDFGFATLLQGKDNQNKLFSQVGTPGFMAPEIEKKIGYFGTAVDIFAAGVVLFLMISASPPFSQANPTTCANYQLLYLNKHNQFWQKMSQRKPPNFYSEQLIQFLNLLFAYDPAQRPTISEIKMHPWFNGPTATLEQIRQKFDAQAQVVENHLILLKRQRDLSRQQPQVQSSLIYTGLNLRSSEEVMEEFSGLDQIFPSLTQPRSIKKHEHPFKEYDFFVTVLDQEYLLHLLLSRSQGFSSQTKLVEGAYKIKCQNEDVNHNSVKFNIELFLDEDETVRIEFLRTEGDSVQYQNIVKKVKQIIEDASGLKNSGQKELAEVEPQIIAEQNALTD